MGSKITDAIIEDVVNDEDAQSWFASFGIDADTDQELLVGAILCAYEMHPKIAFMVVDPPKDETTEAPVPRSTSKYDMATKAREIVLSVKSTGDDATRICDGLIANNLGVISERVAAVVETAAVFCRESRKQGNEASIVAWLVAHDQLDTATRALLELETEDESDAS